MTTLLAGARLVFGNAAELRAFCAQHDLACGSVAEGARAVAGRVARGGRVVITDGARPTTVSHHPGALPAEVYAVPPVASAEVVDSNGCGDAFAGAFLAAHALGKDTASCVRAAHWAAALVIRQRGCSFPESPPRFAW